MTNGKIIANAALEAGLFTKAEVQAAIQTGVSLPLHTFAEWKRMGFAVRKGEKAALKCDIWRFSECKNLRSAESQNDNAIQEKLKPSYYYKKTAFFFTRHQVEKSI